MRTEVELSDWAAVDSWWSAYTQGSPSVRSSPWVRTLQTSGVADRWVDLDPWWQTHANSSPHVGGDDSTWTLVSGWLTDSWCDLDPWWDSYAETGRETAVEIAGLLERSNEAWRESAAPFDTDPLSSAVDRDQGPLLPNNEEDWSDWLAKLLGPSPALVAELFGGAVAEPPDAVVREDRVPKEEGGFRRPDVLVLHSDRGGSIEVKLDDTNYRKTAETARLTEREYPDREWTHTLLLPKRNTGRLRSTVEPPVRTHPDDGLRIEWDDPGPVPVIHWRDVTAALRTLLRRGEAVDDHWAANAYLFCAAAEQQLLNFQPQQMVDWITEPTTVVETIQPVLLADVLGEQLTYLRARRDP